MVDAFGAAGGWLVALGPLAVLLTALFAGGVADRWPPVQAMIGADLLRGMALLGVVAAWSVTGAPSPVALVLAVVVLGAGQAVFRPALQVVLPALVPDRATLPAANVLLDATERIARLLGPTLAGLLSGLLPIRHLLTLDAATFGVSAMALWAVQRRRVIRVEPQSHAPGGVLSSILHGVHAVRCHPVLAYVLTTSGLVNGAWYVAFFLVLPLMVAQNGLIGPGGTGLGAYGLVISAYGCTNLLANLVIGSRDMPERPARLIFGGSLCLGAGIFMLGAIDVAGLPHWTLLPGYMIAAGVAAVGGPMQDIPKAVMRQTLLPPADVPSAMRAFLVVGQGSTLLGLLVAPGLLTILPPAAVLALCGAVIGVTGVIGLRRYA